MKADINLRTILAQFQAFGRALSRHKTIVLILGFCLVYGFILWRINVYVAEGPSDADLTTASQGSAQPHIDPATVQKMKSLQDNSVNVQTLFDQARQNPFNE